MATVVAAMAATHAPGLTGWFERAPEADQKLVLDGYGELRRRLEAARPDVLLMLANDHLLNWPINNIPDYTVGIGDEHVGPADWFDEWLALPKYRVEGPPGSRSRDRPGRRATRRHVRVPEPPRARRRDLGAAPLPDARHADPPRADHAQLHGAADPVVRARLPPGGGRSARS